MILYPLFASNLIACNFEEKEIVDKLFGIVNDYTYVKTEESCKNGPSSTKNKRILVDYPEIKKSLLKYFNNVNENIFHYPCKFDITTSWFTKVTNHYSSHFHSHRNSFYSGVLYFGEYPEATLTAPIEFETPNPDLSNYYIPPTDWNIHNSYRWKVHPQKNTLLFFPSGIKHRIGNHNSKMIRYSLAFNIVPIGSYGEADSFYSTEWFN